jgi:high frequency lysogenization protein
LKNTLQDQLVALAGVFQAAALVERLAKTGTVFEDNYKASIASLFVFDPVTTEEVFGGDPQYRLSLDVGLGKLKNIYSEQRLIPPPRNSEMVTYVVGILHLESKLYGNRRMLDEIEKRLREIEKQIPELGLTHPQVIEGIANCYKETLSTLNFRIHIRGERVYLEDPVVANQVRALLLAGVRAALLWRQVGGRKWHLVLFRGRIQRELGKIA